MTDLSTLLSAVAKKTGLLWIDVPGDRAWPVFLATAVRRVLRSVTPEAYWWAIARQGEGHRP